MGEPRGEFRRRRRRSRSTAGGPASLATKWPSAAPVGLSRGHLFLLFLFALLCLVGERQLVASRWAQLASSKLLSPSREDNNSNEKASETNQALTSKTTTTTIERSRFQHQQLSTASESGALGSLSNVTAAAAAAAPVVPVRAQGKSSPELLVGALKTVCFLS